MDDAWRSPTFNYLHKIIYGVHASFYEKTVTIDQISNEVDKTVETIQMNWLSWECLIIAFK